jgi:hypothetical protein
MKKQDFECIIESVRQAGRIRRGETNRAARLRLSVLVAKVTLP